MAPDPPSRSGPPPKQAGVSRLKERIDAFADFNLPRPHFLSIGEYLDRLVETDVLNSAEAAAVRLVYYRRRYAKQPPTARCEPNAALVARPAPETPEEKQFAEVLSRLEQARIRLERYNDSDRTQLLRRWQTAAEKAALKPAVPRPLGIVGRTARKNVLKRNVRGPDRNIPTSLSVEADTLEADVSDIEPNAKKSAAPLRWVSRWRRWFSRLAAPAFLVWTIAIIGLTYWGHTHIDEKVQNYVSHWRYGTSHITFRQSISRLRSSAAASKGSKRVAMLERLAMEYTERKYFAEAVAAYQLALADSPHDPELLNNLAWLLLTADDVYYRNPRQALPLAERAHELNTSAHIKDTLAEAYYQTGDFSKAVVLEQQALDLHPRRRFFYSQQLAKFQRAEKDHL